MMSFVGDVYQPAEMELGLTRKAIELLIENDIKFAILTKGGTRAVRDFDLLKTYDKCRFGSTICFTNQKDQDFWEKGTTSIENRIEAVEIAHEHGIRTWVSLEPVYYPSQALQLINMLHPIVDHWKVGKINYNATFNKGIDWIGFRVDIIIIFIPISTL